MLYIGYSIAFGKSTSQRIYSEQCTLKRGAIGCVPIPWEDPPPPAPNTQIG